MQGDKEPAAVTRAKLAAQYGIGTVAGFKRTEVCGLECITIRFTDGTSIIVQETSKGVYKTVKPEELPLPEPPREDRIYGDGDRD